MNAKQRYDIHKWLAVRDCDDRLDIRLPSELMVILTDYANERGWSVAHAVRYLVAAGIKEAGR